MSNLLDRASILLSPTAVSDDTLHSVKPVRTFSNELITNGSFDADTNWTKFSDATISGGTANLPNATAAVRQNGVLENNKNYKITYDVISSSGNNVLFTTRGATCLTVDLPSSVGTHTVFARSNSTGGAEFFISVKAFSASAVVDNVSVKKVTHADFDFTRATTATRVNSSGLIESVASGLPRIDFLSGTGHVLMEPASTNTATYSNDFSQGTNFNSGNRILSDSVLSANQGTAPDGTNTAQKITDNNNGGTGSIAISSFGTTLNSGTDSTVSMFVKKDTVRYFVIRFLNFDTTVDASFDLDTGIVNRGTGVMTDYGNGWYRCSTTFNTTTDLVGGIQFLITNSSSGNGGNLRDGSNSTFVWGYQAEYSSFATSYIPTTTSTVTRNKDEAGSSGDSSLMSSTEGTIYAEFAALADEGTTRSISLSDGTSNNRLLLGPHSAAGGCLVNIKTGNVLQVSENVVLSTITDFNKVAIRYKANDVVVFRNGELAASDTSVSLGSADTFTSLQFDAGAGSSDFSGKVKCVAVFKEFLDNDELECLTGSGFDSFTALAEAGSYTII